MPGPKLHADELDTDASLVRRLLGEQFPHWADLPIEPVPSSGTDNALYRLGADMVVRLPRIHWAVRGVDKEQRWLPWLAARLPVAVPVPLAKGRPGQGYPWPWSVYQWLEGENPEPGRLDGARSLALDLAVFVVALRRIDPAGGPPSGRGVPLRERDAETREAIAALHGMVDTGAVTAAWEAALAAPEWDGPAVWIHGDLMPGNLLCTDGRLSAVIDFGGVGVGEPAVDLMPAWNLLPPEVGPVFRDAVGADDATWARARGWALSVALIQLPYYKDTSPTLASSARYVIARVLADHEAGGGRPAWIDGSETSQCHPARCSNPCRPLT